MLLSFRSENLTSISKINDIENLLRDFVLNKIITSHRRKIFIALESYIAHMQAEIIKLQSIHPSIKLPTSTPPIQDLLTAFKASENLLIREANYGYRQNVLNPTADKSSFYKLTAERRSEIILDHNEKEQNEHFRGTTEFFISTEDIARQNRAKKRNQTSYRPRSSQSKYRTQNYQAAPYKARPYKKNYGARQPTYSNNSKFHSGSNYRENSSSAFSNKRTFNKSYQGNRFQNKSKSYNKHNNNNKNKQ